MCQTVSSSRACLPGKVTLVLDKALTISTSDISGLDIAQSTPTAAAIGLGTHPYALTRDPPAPSFGRTSIRTAMSEVPERHAVSYHEILQDDLYAGEPHDNNTNRLITLAPTRLESEDTEEESEDIEEESEDIEEESDDTEEESDLSDAVHEYDGQNTHAIYDDIDSEHSDMLDAPDDDNDEDPRAIYEDIGLDRKYFDPGYFIQYHGLGDGNGHEREIAPGVYRSVRLDYPGNETTNGDTEDAWVPHAQHIETATANTGLVHDDEGADDSLLTRVKVAGTEHARRTNPVHFHKDENAWLVIFHKRIRRVISSETKIDIPIDIMVHRLFDGFFEGKVLKDEYGYSLPPRAARPYGSVNNHLRGRGPPALNAVRKEVMDLSQDSIGGQLYIPIITDEDIQQYHADGTVTLDDINEESRNYALALSEKEIQKNQVYRRKVIKMSLRNKAQAHFLPSNHEASPPDLLATAKESTTDNQPSTPWFPSWITFGTDEVPIAESSSTNKRDTVELSSSIKPENGRAWSSVMENARSLSPVPQSFAVQATESQLLNTQATVSPKIAAIDVSDDVVASDDSMTIFGDPEEEPTTVYTPANESADKESSLPPVPQISFPFSFQNRLESPLFLRAVPPSTPPLKNRASMIHLQMSPGEGSTSNPRPYDNGPDEGSLDMEFSDGMLPTTEIDFYDSPAQIPPYQPINVDLDPFWRQHMEVNRKRQLSSVSDSGLEKPQTGSHPS